MYHRTYKLILIALLCTLSVSAQGSLQQGKPVTPPPPQQTVDRLYKMLGQASEQLQLQAEYIQSLQAKITELQVVIDSSAKQPEKPKP